MSQAAIDKSRNPPRKHHYVPIFYSRQWCGASGKLVRYTRENGRLVERSKHPSATGWAPDLYRMPGEEGPHAQRLEARFFAQLDDKSAAVLRKLTAEPMEPLDELDVGHWSMFIRSLLLRSPSRLAGYKSRSVAEFWEVMADLEHKYESLRRPEDPERFTEYVRLRTAVEGERAGLEHLPSILASDSVLSVLAEAPWLYFDVPADRPPLLLSDSPIVGTNGFLAEQGHIAMPISPRRFIVIARDDKVADYFRTVPVHLLAKGLNHGVVDQARHFVAATDLQQARFIDNRFDPRRS